MLDLIIVIACLFINAFFSAYEMAFVTVSREEIDELEDHSSTQKKLITYKKKPERTLSVIQIGITLVGAIAAAVGGTGAVESMEPWMVKRFHLSHPVAQTLAVVIVIIPLTYFSVILGELVPKTVALKHPLRVVRFGTKILDVIDNFLSPVVTILEISTNFLLRLLHLETNETEDQSMGETIEIGNLPEYHQQFVKNLVSLKGRKVSKTMIPWEKVAYLRFSDSEEEVRMKILASPHSRYPVIDAGVVVGILLKKELSQLLKGQYPWQATLHAVSKVKDTDKILEAFLTMQKKQIPFSVVENDEGKLVGIITIEDIIEEVVGDISDRSDYSKTSKLLANRIRINITKK